MSSVSCQRLASLANAGGTRELLRIIDIDRLQSAYRVRLKKDGSGVEWYSSDGEKETVLSRSDSTVEHSSSCRT